MADSFAFDWWPGLLAWILVFELILLAVMVVARWLAASLGKGDPRDFFVIFHRVFWRAMRSPSLYPLPVNYQPVPPKKPTQQVDAGEQEALTEDELDSLLSCDGDAPASPAASTPAANNAIDEDDVSGGTMRCELDVRVVGPSPQDAVRGIESGVLLIDVTVAPDDGRANGTAIGLVAKVLRVESHQIAITAGHTRPDKTLKISGLSGEDLARRKSEMSGAATQTPASNIGLGNAGDDPWGDEPSLSFQDD